MKRLLLLAVLLATASCSDPAAPGSSPAAGAWRYDASQEAPAAELRGDVMWHATGKADFEGTVSFTESTPNGARLLNGTSAGRVHGDTLAEFTFIISGLSRIHLGILRGDSITGAWSGLAAGSSRGNFVLRRNR